MYIAMRKAISPGLSHSPEEYDRLSMSRIGGGVLKNDNNYVTPKFIRAALSCMNTLMNEYGQVVGRWLLSTSSLQALARAFNLITRRSVYQKPEVRMNSTVYACNQDPKPFAPATSDYYMPPIPPFSPPPPPPPLRVPFARLRQDS